VLLVLQQQMQGQQHLPLAAHLPSLPLPHAAAAAAAAAAGINAGGAAGLMSMSAAAGRLPGAATAAHIHSSGRSSAGLKEEKGLFFFTENILFYFYDIMN